MSIQNQFVLSEIHFNIGFFYPIFCLKIQFKPETYIIINIYCTLLCDSYLLNSYFHERLSYIYYYRVSSL